jgi:hypothetical protein
MKFNVSIDIEVGDGSYILSSFENGHEEDVTEFIKDLMYDIDDITLLDVEVTKTKQR